MKTFHELLLKQNISFVLGNEQVSDSQRESAFKQKQENKKILWVSRYPGVLLKSCLTVFEALTERIADQKWAFLKLTGSLSVWVALSHEEWFREIHGTFKWHLTFHLSEIWHDYRKAFIETNQKI